MIVIDFLFALIAIYGLIVIVVEPISAICALIVSYMYFKSRG